MIHDSLDVVQACVEYGADPYRENDFDDSTAFTIAWDRILGLVKDRAYRDRLQTIFPSSDYLETCGFTTLHQLVFGRAQLTPRELTSYRSSVDMVDNDDSTPLRWAVLHGDVENTQMLLQLGADPNIPDNEGVTPLFMALSFRRWDCVEALLKSPDIDVKYINTTTQLSILHALPKKHYETRVYFESSKSCGMNAKEHQDRDLTRVFFTLVDKGADINACDIYGQSCLYKTITYRNYMLLCMFLNLGADHLRSNSTGQTVLLTAAQYGDCKILELLAK